jgi:hypothetical protein
MILFKGSKSGEKKRHLISKKEKTYNIYSFATQLMTDGVKEFNDYLNM